MAELRSVPGIQDGKKGPPGPTVLLILETTDKLCPIIQWNVNKRFSDCSFSRNIYSYSLTFCTAELVLSVAFIVSKSIYLNVFMKDNWQKRSSWLSEFFAVHYWREGYCLLFISVTVCKIWTSNLSLSQIPPTATKSLRLLSPLLHLQRLFLFPAVVHRGLRVDAAGWRSALAHLLFASFGVCAPSLRLPPLRSAVLKPNLREGLKKKEKEKREDRKRKQLN